jgi:hypothetical protein
MDLSHEIAKKLISLKVGRSANIPASNQQRKKIISNKIDHDDQYDDQEDLTCMVEGCGAMGEEVIALLDESSLSDVDKYDEHHHYDAAAFSSSSQRNNFKNKKSSDDDNNVNNVNIDNLIPAVVCRKHFDKLIEEAYHSKSDLKVVKNK